MENKEQSFIPYGGKLAVLDDCCLFPPIESEKLSEESKKFIDKWNSLDNVSFMINTEKIRGVKND